MHDSLVRTFAFGLRPRPASGPALGLAAALAAVAALAPARAHACSCMPQAQRDAYEQSVAVFEGHVLEQSPPPADQTGQVTVRMKVVRAWKGIESEHAEVVTAANSATCGYAFTVDQSYLVYATTLEGKLHVNLCGRTQPIAGADEDLKALGLGATPVEPKAGPATLETKEGTTPEEPPARGGCAGCAATGESPRSLAAAALPALCALLLVTCRRRSGSPP